MEREPACPHPHGSLIRQLVSRITIQAMLANGTASLAREDIARSLDTAIGGLAELQRQVDDLKKLVDAAVVLGGDR